MNWELFVWLTVFVAGKTGVGEADVIDQSSFFLALESELFRRGLPYSRLNRLYILEGAWRRSIGGVAGLG